MSGDVKLTKRGKYFYIYFGRHNEKSLRKLAPGLPEKYYTEEKLANRLLKEIERKILKGKLHILEKEEKITLKQFAEEYLEWSQAHKAHSTYKRDALALRKLINFLGDTPLRVITLKKIEDYHSFLLKTNKPSGVNVEIRHLKAAFNKAVLWGYLKENPYSRIRPLKVYSEPPKFLSIDEINQVLDAIKDQDFKDMIICYLETGCRRKELLNLTKDDINFDAGLIKIKGKGGKVRYVPMTETVAEIMARRAKQSPLFPALHPDTVTHKWIKLMKKLGLKYRLHDLRHTTASHLVRKGVDIRRIQEILRHSDIRTTTVYAHLLADDLREALEETFRFVGRSYRVINGNKNKS